MRETITLAEAHARFRTQGASDRRHIAFVCPVCGTVQSIASLVAAGCEPERAESCVAFSCEGRFSGAGPFWPRLGDPSEQAEARRAVRGCDWSLGGLFHIHELEVVFPGSTEPRPSFVIATKEQAQQLEREMLEASVATRKEP